MHATAHPLTTGARSAAITAGTALAAMAVLAPIAVFGLIPAGFTAVAALLVLTVAGLDVIAAVALIPVLERGGRTIAIVTAGLRVTYAAVFAVAASNLMGTADVAAFNRVWDAGPLIFALHLIALGVLAWRSGNAPRWIAALVLVAGAGYLLDAVLAATSPGFGFEFATVAFVGEVALLLWLLIRGGRK